MGWLRLLGRDVAPPTGCHTALARSASLLSNVCAADRPLTELVDEPQIGMMPLITSIHLEFPSAAVPCLLNLLQEAFM